MSFLVGEKISKKFRSGYLKAQSNWVLKDLSFELSLGEGLWVRGKNGSGKTTLLRILATLSLPTEGKVFLEGSDLANGRTLAQENMAYVPAEHLGFYGRLTNHDNLKLFTTLNDRVFQAEAPDTRHLINALGLDPFLDTLFEKSSSGVRKKFLLLAALLKQPKVLLIDEIFSNIDEGSRQQITEILNLQMKKNPMALVWVAHDSHLPFGFPCKELQL